MRSNAGAASESASVPDWPGPQRSHVWPARTENAFVPNVA